jgi:hypothetical protein
MKKFSTERNKIEISYKDFFNDPFLYSSYLFFGPVRQKIYELFE